ncbi:hypothetical protein ACWGDS_11080 [Streptomyces sp. NPDC055059]|jgi:hypothetical protein
MGKDAEDTGGLFGGAPASALPPLGALTLTRLRPLLVGILVADGELG